MVNRGMMIFGVCVLALSVLMGCGQSGDGGDVGSGSQSVQIALNGNSITANGSGVTVAGSTATITSAGTYSLSGSLADGQIIVDAPDQGTVRLVLNGATISSSTSAPIFVKDADETVIVLAEDTDNRVSDAESYVFPDPADDEPNAAIFSKDDLVISGQGSLTVEGNYNDGIASKDSLVIASGTITVNAVDDGIRGKDQLVVQDGHITVTAQGDGLKSDNEEDATLGYITIEAGVLNITTGGDAIQAASSVTITSGEFDLSAGGGSNGRIDQDTSAKGIKAGVSVRIDGGTWTIDTADDAIHSNDSMVINGGTFVIATGDDGMHADATLTVNAGDFQITESYEGIESAVITINDGNFHIVSRDDGLNVAAGNDGSGMNWGAGQGGRPVPGGDPGQGGVPGPGGRPGRGGDPGQGQVLGPGGGPGQDVFAYTGDNYLYIHGGYMVIDAAGDGLDVNGAVEMTNGVVIVNGPTENMNGALDHASFKITGGFLVAAGSSGMAQAPDASSTQHSLLLNFNGTLQAGTLVRIQTSGGDEVLTFAPTKVYQSIAFSSPELTNGTTYDVYYGGNATGTAKDGLYQDGAYTPGTQYTSFTISGVVTRLGGTFR